MALRDKCVPTCSYKDLGGHEGSGKEWLCAVWHRNK